MATNQVLWLCFLLTKDFSLARGITLEVNNPKGDAKIQRKY